MTSEEDLHIGVSEAESWILSSNISPATKSNGTSIQIEIPCLSNALNYSPGSSIGHHIQQDASFK